MSITGNEMFYQVFDGVQFGSVNEMLSADQTEKKFFAGRHSTDGQVLLHQDDLTTILIDLKFLKKYEISFIEVFKLNEVNEWSFD